MDKKTGEIDTTLQAAYRATLYRVDAPTGPFVLQIDKHSTALADLHRARGVTSSAFITAWNPRSEQQPAAVNRQAQQALETELRDRGFHCLPGEGRDAAGQWPAEASVLVLGIGAEEARELGRRYGQNAVVYMGEDAVPVLLGSNG